MQLVLVAGWCCPLWVVSHSVSAPVLVLLWLVCLRLALRVEYQLTRASGSPPPAVPG